MIVNLPSCSVNEDVFIHIVNAFKNGLIIVQDVSEYASFDKYQCVYYDGQDYIVCQLRKIAICCSKMQSKIIDMGRLWRQFIVRRNINQSEEFKMDITPITAKAMIMKELYKKGLSKKDIALRLHMYEAEYNPRFIQMHKLNVDSDIFDNECVIYKFNDCIYYDINKAHMDALKEIFPELTDYFSKLIESIKHDIMYKAVANYFVGLLAYKTAEQRAKHLPGKYEKTYNWIVQRTTKLLLKRIGEDTNKIVYANTDGVIIQKPSVYHQSSSKVGEFKVAYTGTVYTYHTKGGWILQCGNDIKSNIKKSMRKDIDLSKGKCIEVIDRNNNKYKVVDNIDVIEVKL